MKTTPVVLALAALVLATPCHAQSRQLFVPGFGPVIGGIMDQSTNQMIKEEFAAARQRQLIEQMREDARIMQEQNTLLRELLARQKEDGQ